MTARSAVDRTPNDEIQRVRIRRVKRLLTTTDLSLNDIAGKVGFEYAEYLSTVFKKGRRQEPHGFPEVGREVTWNYRTR